MKTIDNAMVCIDCLSVIANGDYSGLAMHPDTEDQRTGEINKGLDEMEGSICVGDSGLDCEFSKQSCDCCESPLAGSRHHCVVLAATTGGSTNGE